MTKRIIFILLLTFLLSSLRAGIIKNQVDPQRHLDLAQQPSFDCVGYVKLNGTKKGSCVYIGNGKILTSAHVLKIVETHPDTVMIGETKYTLYLQVFKGIAQREQIKVVLDGEEFGVQKVAIHRRFIDNGNPTGNCDLAIIHIDGIAPDMEIPRLNWLENEISAEVIAVGYGELKNKSFETLDSNSLTKIAGTNIIDRASGYFLNDKFTLLSADFDSGDSGAINISGNAIGTPLEYLPMGGESGGGLFRKTENGYDLVGITTSSSLCQSNNAGLNGAEASWTRVSAFHTWIIEN